MHCVASRNNASGQRDAGEQNGNAEERDWVGRRYLEEEAAQHSCEWEGRDQAERQAKQRGPHALGDDQPLRRTEHSGKESTQAN